MSTVREADINAHIEHLHSQYIDEQINEFLSLYIGEKCKYCQQEFKTLEDMDGAVWTGSNNDCIAHKRCYDENNPLDAAAQPAAEER